MSERKEPRDRSVSGDLESDLESYVDPTNPPGKPGRKKNPNSQAARRDQNRIAQREFRLRKQQRIRDLEARVEILSGGKDEAMGEMRNILKDLMAENQNLRNMLRNLATFIGEGLGGVLPKLGWDLNDFNAFINRGETDTAWDSYQRRKKNPQKEQTEPPTGAGSSSSSSVQGQKRSAEDGPLSSRAKKARNEDNEVERSQNGFNLISAMPPASMSSGLYGPDSRPIERSGIFSDLIRGPNHSFSQSPAGSSPSLQYGGMTGNLDHYQNSYLAPVNMAMNPPLAPNSYESQNASSSQARIQPATGHTTSDELEVDDDPNKSEAYKLIHYHLENYKRNSNYCLPSSLRPTVVQRSIPHESAIDSVLHPDLRDRMIIHRQRYELVDLLVDYRRAITIHGDDVLAHSNWEVGEAFFRKYSFLAELTTFNISNRWRKERGEPELATSEFITEQPPPA